jgi:hypothetical protein
MLLIAIFFRQSNIVWVVFCLGLLIIKNIEIVFCKRLLCATMVLLFSFVSHMIIIRCLLADPRFKVYGRVQTALRATLHVVFRRFVLYTGLILAMIVFIYWNGSVVLGEALHGYYHIGHLTIIVDCYFVGDKTNHKQSLHLAQLVYLSIWLCLCNIVDVVQQLALLRRRRINVVTKSRVLIGIILWIFISVLMFFALKHFR